MVNSIGTSGGRNKSQVGESFPDTIAMPTKMPRFVLEFFHLVHEVRNFHGGQHAIDGVRVIGEGDAAHAHEGIADGPELLQIVARGDCVEEAEAGVEFGHEIFRREAFDDFGESLEVGEEYGGGFEADGLRGVGRP